MFLPRQGLGRLLAAMFEVARKLSFAEAWILTDRKNTAAMNLYSAVCNAEIPSDHVMTIPARANEDSRVWHK